LHKVRSLNFGNPQWLCPKGLYPKFYPTLVYDLLFVCYCNQLLNYLYIIRSLYPYISWDFFPISSISSQKKGFQTHFFPQEGNKSFLPGRNPTLLINDWMILFLMFSALYWLIAQLMILKFGNIWSTQHPVWVLPDLSLLSEKGDICIHLKSTCYENILHHLSDSQNQSTPWHSLTGTHQSCCHRTRWHCGSDKLADRVHQNNSHCMLERHRKVGEMHMQGDG